MFILLFTWTGEIMKEQLYLAGRLIKQINDELEKTANNNLRDLGLTVSQLDVLRYLYHAENGSLTMKEVEKKLHVAQSTATGIAMRLELKKLITARGDEKDRRIKVIVITPEGRSICMRAKASIQAVEKRLISSLTEEEQVRFVDMLQKVREAMILQENKQ